MLGEGNLAAVQRPGRAAALGIAAGQLLDILAVSIHDEETPPAAVARRGEHDLCAVGRPRGAQVMARLATGLLGVIKAGLVAGSDTPGPAPQEKACLQCAHFTCVPAATGLATRNVCWQLGQLLWGTSMFDSPGRQGQMSWYPD